MAKAPRVSNIEPEAMYRVKLSRVVVRNGHVMRPRDDVVVKGKVIAELGDAVVAIERA